ncbi:MAG: uroporphyrinogen-III C-methyltransferase [Pirellulales bacterium]
MGMVYLVGAGPGDPGLITLRGVECLAQADVVLYDALVNPRILRHASATAQQISLGKHGQSRVVPQEEVNRQMIAAARAGQTVVRLKGGDPAVFARAAEEAAALEAAGIPYEIVPGVTAALAVAGYAGIPLTHRDWSSAVALVTGHENDSKAEPALDYRSLAAFPGTLVFYMGVTSARQWTAQLIAGGKPADTPAAIVRRCSWPDQILHRCTLATVAEVLAEKHLRPPLVVVVGAVVNAPAAATWFTQRPLFGVRVLVTRPADQAAGLTQPLEQLGAEVLEQPAIEISEPPDWSAADVALARLGDYDWLVFSSSNGVKATLDRLCRDGRDLRALCTLRLAAVGPGTAEELARYHLRADVVPPEFRAESLADALSGDAAGKRFLLARASRGREILAERLRQAGGQVDQVVVYHSGDVEHPRPEIAARIEQGTIDWITVTSSAIARSLHRLFGEHLRRIRLASISPVTTATLHELGLTPAAEATEYTMPGLVAAILRENQA